MFTVRGVTYSDRYSVAREARQRHMHCNLLSHERTLVGRRTARRAERADSETSSLFSTLYCMRVRLRHGASARSSRPAWEI